ncbi:hypothetical protein [Streptomyces sp. cg36]|uniref:hypothetical protein n=1 Tax=Streptomyces sp. cg36 TaxID=3238798 RepID=UPI0034E2E67F
MAMSLEELKNRASVVIESSTGPIHVGSGQQINADAAQDDTARQGGTGADSRD